jgi:hypothetical protein
MTKLQSEIIEKATEEGIQIGKRLAREEVREKIENYFEGLIFIPNPQATKKSLLLKLQSEGK